MKKYLTEVADDVMPAYPVIFDALAADFPSATIQSLQDSVVIECDEEHVTAVRDLVAKAMSDALDQRGLQRVRHG